MNFLDHRMRLENRDLLISMSGPGRCELCGKKCRDREAHHHRRRGMGSGQRLDIRINLISLGSAFDCGCHHRVENIRSLDADVALIIARREGYRREDIADVIAALLQVPLDAPDALLDERASVMTPEGRGLFMRVVMEERKRLGVLVEE